MTSSVIWSLLIDRLLFHLKLGSLPKGVFQPLFFLALMGQPVKLRERAFAACKKFCVIHWVCIGPEPTVE
jgi:hypothetical protein